MFIIEGIEISTFSLVRSLWRVDEHVSIGVVPSVVVVSIKSFLIVNCVHKHIVLTPVFLKIFKPLNELSRVVEPSA